MSSKSCSNCGETADAAKAFCPGCGNAFVAEDQRVQNSEFEAVGSTVQFSQSAFNMVLSGMGLDISESPDRPSKPEAQIHIQPVGNSPASSIKNRTDESTPATSSRLKWILMGVAAIAVVLAVVVSVAAFAFYFYLKQT